MSDSQANKIRKYLMRTLTVNVGTITHYIWDSRMNVIVGCVRVHSSLYRQVVLNSHDGIITILASEPLPALARFGDLIVMGEGQEGSIYTRARARISFEQLRNLAHEV